MKKLTNIESNICQGGGVPADELVLTAGVDVQKDHIHIVIRSAESLDIHKQKEKDGGDPENNVPEGGCAEQAVGTLGHAEECHCLGPRK